MARALQQAAATLLERREQSALAIVAVCVAVYAALVLVAVVQGFGDQAAKLLTRELGADLLWVLPRTATAYSRVRNATHTPSRRMRITRADVDAVRAAPDVGAVSALVAMHARLSTSKRRARTRMLVGCDLQYFDLLERRLRAGRRWTPAEATQRRRIVILGARLASQLFPRGAAVGRAVRVGEQRFTVLGVLQSQTHGMASDTDQQALLPLSTWRAVVPKPLGMAIVLRGRAGIPEEQLRGQVVRALAIGAKQGGGLNGGVRIVSAAAQQRRVRRWAAWVTAAVASSAAIALVVGTLGMLNVMLTSVAQRGREIGIRRAVGARRRDVAAQFLVESLLLACAGCAAALVGAQSSVVLLRLASPLEPRVPPVLFPGVIVLALVVGVASGWLPARRASQRTPLGAMRGP